MSYATYCRLQVPVWASDRQVIRTARMRIPKRIRHNPELRWERKRFYVMMLEHHHKAQELCTRFAM